MQPYVVASQSDLCLSDKGPILWHNIIIINDFAAGYKWEKG